MGKKTKKESLLEIEDLRVRLEEAEETLSAIRRGEVDGLVVPQKVRRKVRRVNYNVRLLRKEIKDSALYLS